MKYRVEKIRDDIEWLWVIQYDHGFIILNCLEQLQQMFCFSEWKSIDQSINCSIDQLLINHNHWSIFENEIWIYKYKSQSTIHVHMVLPQSYLKFSLKHIQNRYNTKTAMASLHYTTQWEIVKGMKVLEQLNCYYQGYLGLIWPWIMHMQRIRTIIIIIRNLLLILLLMLIWILNNWNMVVNTRCWYLLTERGSSKWMSPRHNVRMPRDVCRYIWGKNLLHQWIFLLHFSHCHDG